MISLSDRRWGRIDVGGIRTSPLRKFLELRIELCGHPLLHPISVDPFLVPLFNTKTNMGQHECSLEPDRLGVLAGDESIFLCQLSKTLYQPQRNLVRPRKHYFLE